MRRAAAAFLVLAALTGPARAEVPTAETCRASWERLSRDILAGMGDVRTGPQVWLREGVCAVDSVEISPEAEYQPGVRIGKVSWNANGLKAFLDAGTPPQSLDLKVEDLHIAIKTGNDLMDYLMRAQNEPNGIDAELSLHWEAGDRRLVLERLDIDFPGDNAIKAAASLDRVDLTTQSAAQVSLGSMGLTDLSVEVTTNGLFEGFALMPLGNMILGHADDPEAELAAYVDEAQAFVRSLPGATFAEPTKQAIAALLEELPNPAGTFALTLRAPDGIGAARAMRLELLDLPEPADAIGALFGGVTVTATYTPTAEGAE